MKNLYIHKLDANGNFTTTIWKDIKITRDKGQIVKRKGSDYNISHGQFKLKENLEIVNIIETGFPIVEVNQTEYITFNEEMLSDDTKKRMAEPFIKRFENEINELQRQITEVEKLKNKFIEI